MQPCRRLCIYASMALFAPLAAPRAHAKNLTITTSPPGARVEIDGLFAGITPYTTDFPGGYFHKTHTIFGSRLDHAMVLTVSKDGYLTEKVTITNGPFAWTAINGRHHGKYFLLKSDHFHIRLEPLPAGKPRETGMFDHEGPMRPAKVQDFDGVSGRDGAGTGTVAISSNPRQAEIYVDGEFEGQTPAKLQLPSGLHHFEIKFAHQQKWERDLDVLAGSKLTLNASPESSP